MKSITRNDATELVQFIKRSVPCRFSNYSAITLVFISITKLSEEALMERFEEGVRYNPDDVIGRHDDHPAFNERNPITSTRAALAFWSSLVSKT